MTFYSPLMYSTTTPTELKKAMNQSIEETAALLFLLHGSRSRVLKFNTMRCVIGKVCRNLEKVTDTVEKNLTSFMQQPLHPCTHVHVKYHANRVSSSSIHSSKSSCIAEKIAGMVSKVYICRTVFHAAVKAHRFQVSYNASCFSVGNAAIVGTDVVNN